MKWIAKRDFYRTPQLAEIVITGGCKGAPQPDAKTRIVPLFHPNHIHRGGIFELGKWSDEKELQAAKNTEPLKILIAELRLTGCMSDASDAQCVERIEREIAVDVKREANRAALNKQADANTVLALLTGMAQIAAKQNTAQ